jgi:hypothetical protein
MHLDWRIISIAHGAFIFQIPHTTELSLFFDNYRGFRNNIRGVNMTYQLEMCYNKKMKYNLLSPNFQGDAAEHKLKKKSVSFQG